MPGQYGFPRRERLVRKKDFLRIYGEGRKYVGREFVCYVVRQPGQGRKIGFTVSRKVGSAVVRNRVKRYLREVYRHCRPQFADNAQVVIVARPTSAALSYAGCRDVVRELLCKGDVLIG